MPLQLVWTYFYLDAFGMTIESDWRRGGYAALRA